VLTLLTCTSRPNPPTPHTHKQLPAVSTLTHLTVSKLPPPQMKVSTSRPNPNASDSSTGVIILYCGAEGDEAGTKAIGRTILAAMEYRGECAACAVLCYAATTVCCLPPGGKGQAAGGGQRGTRQGQKPSDALY
jgi:hypothetical protein